MLPYMKSVGIFPYTMTRVRRCGGVLLALAGGLDMGEDGHPAVPTLGLSVPIPSWDEYAALKTALEAYLDHGPEDAAWDGIWRALAAILDEYQLGGRSVAHSTSPSQPSRRAFGA